MFSFQRNTLQLKNCLGLNSPDRFYYANLFSDGFESGDLTAWSSSVTDSGNLSAAAGAALHGSYGLSAVINDTTAIYVIDETPSAVKRYRCRFYLDPNSISMPADSVLMLVFGKEASFANVFAIDLVFEGGVYKIKARDNTDANNWSATTDKYEITDAPHCIEVDWKASSGVGANDGFIELLIDGVSKQTVSGIDHDLNSVDFVRFGAASVPASISGTLYLDDFASNNDGAAIGTITTLPKGGMGLLGVGA